MNMKFKVRKNFIHWPIFIMIAILFATFLLVQVNNYSNDQITEGILASVDQIEKNSDRPSFTGDLNDVAPLKASDFTKEDLDNYYKVYSDPYVIHLRKSLNGYLDGTNYGMDAPEFIISGNRDIEESTGHKSGLASFDKSYYKSKFIVLSLENSITGGMNITFVFQDKSDRIFWAWIYPLRGEGDEIAGYDLRGFSEMDMSHQDQLYFIKLYENFIQDKEHAI